MLPRTIFSPSVWMRAAVFVFVVGFCYQSQAQLIYYNDFNQYPTSKRYRTSDLDNDWNSPKWDKGISQRRVKLVDDYEAFDNTGMSLSVKYPRRKYGVSATGASFQYDFDQEYTHVFLSYSFKFKRGFDFVKGGKLPGLAGGSAPTGNAPANGYNGWTGRLMWRTDHTGNPGSPKQKTASMLAYSKYYKSGPDEEGRIEDETYFTKSDGNRVTIESGKWYNVTQRIQLNHPAMSNGVMQIWLDDQLVVDRSDIRYRKTDSLKIDQMYFSTFFGGGYSWRTSKYETAYFDNFSIFAVE